MAPEKLNSLVFYDPDGPLAKEMTALPEEKGARDAAVVKATWALACTGAFVWPLPDKGLKRRIHRATAPALIVWGKQDRLVPPAYAQEFASKLKDARVELIDKAAHVPQLEQRKEVSSLVTKFLAS